MQKTMGVHPLTGFHAEYKIRDGEIDSSKAEECRDVASSALYCWRNIIILCDVQLRRADKCGEERIWNVFRS